MRIRARLFLVAFTVLLAGSTARAQKSPELGYVFPPGGKAGTTVEVVLGGYDWTPDMEFFVHDKRVQLIPTGPPGPILIPGPPYWYGAKGRITGPPLPREVPAKFVIPADMAPGPVVWQAANANGATSAGVFIVGNGPEVADDERRKSPQLLPGLPVTISGRLQKIEEVDRYRFVAAKDGPISCEVMARRLGAKFLPMFEVRSADGRLIADASGANGNDPALTFAAKAGAEYTVSLHDLDFGGDRSYVYRLAITPGPRVVGAIPAAGKRGETREVEFVGYGVATGSAKLESVRRQITFPKDTARSSFDYAVETPFGATQPFRLFLSDLPEIVGVSQPGESRRAGPALLTEPVGITGVLDGPDSEDRYFCSWNKGDVWSISAEARRLRSPLDVAIAVIGPDGKELARNDDLPETTDAGLEFIVPANGAYQIVVSDTSGKSGNRAAIYRLVVSKPSPPDFSLHVAAQRVSVPIGDRAQLAVRATRRGGFKGPINLTVRGLPVGIETHPVLVIPPDRIDILIPLHGDAQAASGAALATVEGKADGITRTATAKTTFNQSPRTPQENEIENILVAATLKPRFKGRPVDQDTGRKVHRGSTFPAEVIVERLGDFNGEITLQMASVQSYAHQGITGGDVIVPPGIGLAIYPCFMPEWLETSRTSRMGMIAVAKVADPTGKVRYMVNEITGFITMTLEGALLKIAAEEPEITVAAGRPFDVRLKVSRLTKLTEPARLELILPEELTGKINAEPVTVGVGAESVVLRVSPEASVRGTHSLTIRATAMQDGKYPAVSETNVVVEFGGDDLPRR
jgi:hypothetical protein